ncbi:hypothetical protein QJS04_geneDACA013794 [Acorus gramineus]|uniref:Vacuolar iron transporter n=1 Tax=Acorus gramineus TaxID=55184 RepID=A0AAV9AV52_ACOGR|nr:hypothetical protein QJS04_geneDACA013794 [Acorus gramineus]
MAVAVTTDFEIKITVIATNTDSTSSFDYSQRSQWIHTVDLGANDGLVSTSSLMMGVGAVKSMAMVFSGFAGLVAGTCGLATWLSAGSSPSTPSSTLNSSISRGGCRGVGESVEAGIGSGGIRGGAQGEVGGCWGSGERGVGGVGAR